MKLLVLGAYDSSNLGDPIICDCVAFWLRGHFPHGKTVVKDVLPRGKSGEADLQKMRRYWLRNRLRRMMTGMLHVDLVYRQYSRWIAKSEAYMDALCAEDYDAVVFAGGQMFMDRYTLFLAEIVRRFRARNIPVFFNACGTGPAYSPKIARVLKETLKSPNVRYVSSRDNAALVTEKYAPCRETFDPALTAAEVYGVSKAEKADTIGLGVIFNQEISEEKQTVFWQKLVRELDRRGEKWQFFTNGDPLDMAYARLLLTTMPGHRGNEEKLLRPRDTEPEALVRTIAGYRSILSFRLHSHILAASLDVPSVAMVWDRKLPFFFEKVGHPERCFRVDSDPVTVLDTLSRAEREGHNRELLSQQIRSAKEQLLRAMTDAIPVLTEGE